MSIDADVVKTGLPLILDLKVFSKSRMLLDFENDKIKSSTDGRTAILISRNGHVNIQWEPSIL